MSFTTKQHDVQEAKEMGENEHLLNVYVQKNAPGSCAEFYGYTVVNRSDRVSDKRITPGKWLVCLHSAAWRGRSAGSFPIPLHTCCVCSSGDMKASRLSATICAGKTASTPLQWICEFLSMLSSPRSSLTFWKVWRCAYLLLCLVLRAHALF